MNLLQRLVETIKKSADCTISRVCCMIYLLGEKIENNYFSDTALYKIYAGETSLSNTHLKDLAKSKDWSFQRLEICLISGTEKVRINQQLLIDELYKIADEYHIHTTSDISSMVKPLVHLYFFGMPDSRLLFPAYNKRGCDNYVSWPSMEQKILDSLKTKQLLFLVGNPATGKKQLLISQLNKYTHFSYPDVFWLDSFDGIDLPLEKRITKISFFGYHATLPLNTILEFLKQKPATSVLVIDMPSIKQEDLSFIDNYLTVLRMRIIIITRCHTIPDTYKVINIACPPVENLSRIFRQINNTNDLSDNDLKRLFDIVDHNPYIVTLIAKGMAKSKSSLSKEELLDDTKWIWYKTTLPKLHSSYPNPSDKSAQKLHTLICRILSVYPSNYLYDHASELSIWTKHPLKQSSLEKYFGHNVISQAIAYGILLYFDKDNTKLFMPRIIADAIWKQFPINYTDYRTKIFEFLSIIETGKPSILPYEDLYQIIFNMALRFHFQTTIMPSRIDSKSKNIFQEWNNTLTEIIEHYMQLGNWKFAQETLPYLYTSETKRGTIIAPTKSQQYIQQLLQAQTQYMQSDNFYVALGEIIHTLTDWKNYYDSLSKSAGSKEETYILYLAQLIIQDLTDHIISIELKAAAHYWTGDPLFDYNIFQKNILVLQKCSAHLISSNFSSGYYSMSACHFLAAIYSGYGGLCHTASCPNRLLLNKTLSPELHFKSECLCFYYRLFIFYIELAQEIIKDPNDAFRAFAQEYNLLYTKFHENMWSYNASYLFYSCTILLQLFLPQQEFSETHRNLTKSMEMYKSFNTKQLSLSEEQAKEFNRKTDDWLSYF